MKTLIINFVVLIALSLVGCQENQITDPILDSNSNKTSVQEDYKYGTISLQRMLTDPQPVGNSYYYINGQIDYKHRLITTNPVVDPTQNHFALNLNIVADLSYYCSVCPYSEEDDLAGFIDIGTEELVPITGHFSSRLEKTFKIQGRDDGMVLKCRFQITTGGVELSAMWLALENNSVKATVNY